MFYELEANYLWAEPSQDKLFYVNNFGIITLKFG